MEHKELNAEKILGVVAFIFITLSLYVITLIPPAAGYEISIYDAYPAYFWFFLITAITCGVVILLRHTFAEKKSSSWLVGLAIIIFANSIFLLLPKFRGYAFYGRYDTLAHLGRIKDIMITGHVGGSNSYPITHILGAILIQVVGLSLENILSLFFVLFSETYIVNMYLWARSTTNNPGQVLLTVAFASPLIYSFFHVNIHPSILSLFMVPCLLYFYQKREHLPYDRRKNTAILLLLAFFITFFHPITTLYVIVIFLTFGLAHALYSRFLIQDTSGTSQHRSVGRNFFGVSLIMFIAFFTWYFSYSLIQQSFKVVYDWLVYQIGTPLVESILGQLGEAELTPSQSLELFMNRHGAAFLLLLISGIACISVFHKSLLRKHNVKPMKFIYAIQFPVALFIGVAMLFGYFPEYEYNPTRLFMFSLLMGTIINGLVVHDFINRESKKNPTRRKAAAQRSGFMIIIAAVIIAMVALSLGSIYGSSYNSGGKYP